MITVKEYDGIREVIPSCDFISADGIVEKSRVIKDDGELEKIRQAAKIADIAFSYILDRIRPGVSEREIAWLLERKIERGGRFRSVLRHDLRIGCAFLHAPRSSHRCADRKRRFCDDGFRLCL